MPEPAEPPRPPVRRRRRAVGPPGARPGVEPHLDGETERTERTEQPPVDDDERLLREVPPHHG